MRRTIRLVTFLLGFAVAAFASDALVLVGTVTNTTDETNPVKAALTVSLDANGHCIVRVGAPLYGSGTCTISAKDDSKTIVIVSNGPLLDITWTGTGTNDVLAGTYVVTAPALPQLPERGTFELREDNSAKPLELKDVLSTDSVENNGHKYQLWLERDLLSIHESDGTYAGRRVFLNADLSPKLIIADTKTGSTFYGGSGAHVLAEWVTDGKSGIFMRTTDNVTEYFDRFWHSTGWSSVLVSGKTIYAYEDASGAELFDAAFKSLGIQARKTASGKLYWTSVQDGISIYYDESFKPLDWYSFQSNGQTIFAHGHGKKFKFYDSSLNQIKIAKKPGFWANFGRGLALGLAAYGQALQAQAAAEQQQQAEQGAYGSYGSYSAPSTYTTYNSTSQSLGSGLTMTNTYDSSGESYTTSSQRIGNFTFSNTTGSNGYTANSTTTTIGQFDFTNGSSNAGSFSGSTQRIGAFAFTNLDTAGGNWSGTSQQIGNFKFHNFTGPNGQTLTGTSQRIGDFIFTDIR